MARSQIHYQKPRIRPKNKSGLRYKLTHWLRRVFKRSGQAPRAR